ncbi:response regulator transcription factor [Ilumatobacter nonamiensis]|uniref:response regulator transcription factor n=1 Tax=Ilumatobacter nonamiensis TaxID=467093 RepID=UPI00034B5143|nr:response regulator transcription factor [Ilumatobacter nonamiensis]
MSERTVLVAEDDAHVREALERALRFEGYVVVGVRDGAAALAGIDEHTPDVIVLDVSMPFVDGLTVCRRLRARGDRTPVLILTARGDVGDRVDGLDAGADDYLAKPFALDELLARLRALLRRVEDPEVGRLELDDLTLDLASRDVNRGDRLIELTPTEFEILVMLMRNAGVVLHRPFIYSEIWGYESDTSSKALDVHIRLLRRKLEAAGEDRVLHTVHGVGYVLRPASTETP